MAVKKISVSMDAEELAWLRRVAREQKKTVSGLLAEATRLMRQLRARREVIEYLGGEERLTPRRAKEIDREWKG
jgi:hypothetical protein